ncbi:MAG: hypothetical protein COS40_09015 [Deltaproteobacteria bacterium CG03_land_8_20_14_0_80_45_14]|nr:MAG: hypothetical protein COS40_09015 [Deltaproteobacteria bacterium CG03_land_8_20_14_0_80_45_14]
MRYWNDDFYFWRRRKHSLPREAKGGIKAQSKRGTFGESWWARRWIAVLESFNIGARLGRGRSYARRGQVLSIEIDKGKVSGKVQGSRPKPYDVKLQVKTLSVSDWQKLTKVLSRQAIFSAKLLMGEMPLDIEKVFKEAGLSLFPEKLKDLKTACSCPDWSNPCKHIAAVYYLLAEEFDRDPFLIFKLRGMNREDLIVTLSRSDKKVTQKKAKPKQEPLHKDEEALTSDISKFWNGESISDDIFGEVRIPSIAAALPKRLGSFPFWRGEEKFLDVMESIYANASPVGLKVFLGEGISEEKT